MSSPAPGTPNTAEPPPRRTAVLVPVKAFHEAKARLAPALAPQARAELARTMAAQVVRAAGALPVSVVCDDAAVAAWAADQGAQVITCPGRGLNGAVTDGVATLADQGFAAVIVAHGDLPYALDLTWLARGGDEVIVVPDRREDGTNVLRVPAHAGFSFAYGPGSFERHCAEARRLGLALRIEHEARLAWDVDVPADLAAPDWSLAG